MPYALAIYRSGSSTSGNSTFAFWVSFTSFIHSLCDSIGVRSGFVPTLTTNVLAFLLSNSPLRFATRPISVVQTGVKSAGCDIKTPQLSPNQLWKSISPSVVLAVKFGA